MNVAKIDNLNFDKLYKILEDIPFKDMTIKQIEYNFLLHDEVSPTIVLPTDTIKKTDSYYDYSVVGYVQPYIPSHNLQNCLKKNIPVDKKKLIVQA